MRKPLRERERARRSAFPRLAKLPSCTTHPPEEPDDWGSRMTGCAGELATCKLPDPAPALCGATVAPAAGGGSSLGAAVACDSGGDTGACAAGIAGSWLAGCAAPSVRV